MTKDLMESSAVGYVRVSTDQQVDHGVSLETQHERIRAYTLLHKLNLVEIVSDEGISGSIPLADRAGGRRVLDLLRHEGAGHVVALKLDRLFRDAADALVQTRIWDRKGIAVHLIDVGGQTIITSSAMGRMFLTMMSGFAELERNLIAERTATALQHKRSRRQVYNHTPLGFVRDGDTLVPDAGEQLVVEKILAMRTEGMSYGKIAAGLNEDGITGKLGGRFHASTIQKIVANDLHGPVA